MQQTDMEKSILPNQSCTAAHILPYDPVAKKRAATGSKRTAAQISLVEVPETAEISASTKVSIGKLGYTYGTIPHRSTPTH